MEFNKTVLLSSCVVLNMNTDMIWPFVAAEFSLMLLAVLEKNKNSAIIYLHV